MVSRVADVVAGAGAVMPDVDSGPSPIPRSARRAPSGMNVRTA